MAATLLKKYTGGAANSTPADALGGTGSSETLSATALNNLFANADPTEAAAGSVKYRAIDIKNEGDATGKIISIWISTVTPSTDSICAIALDATGTQELANEDETPASPALNFVQHLTGNKLSLGDLAVNGTHRIFIRRTITAGATNYSTDGIVLSVQYA